MNLAELRCKKAYNKKYSAER